MSNTEVMKQSAVKLAGKHPKKQDPPHGGRHRV